MTSKTKHTPEPWGYVQDWPSWEGYYLPEDGGLETVFKTDTEATAKRIVDCVNSCAGMENPELQIQQLKTGNALLELERIKLTERISELEKKLKEMNTND